MPRSLQRYRALPLTRSREGQSQGPPELQIAAPVSEERASRPLPAHASSMLQRQAAGEKWTVR
jgi:hypothetical protein